MNVTYQMVIRVSVKDDKRDDHDAMADVSRSVEEALRKYPKTLDDDDPIKGMNSANVRTVHKL